MLRDTPLATLYIKAYAMLSGVTNDKRSDDLLQLKQYLYRCGFGFHVSCTRCRYDIEYDAIISDAPANRYTSSSNCMPGFNFILCLHCKK